LGAVKDGIRSDVKIYNAIGDFEHRLRQWRKAKRQAMRMIRDHREFTGDSWLPKPLFDLKAEAEKAPGKTPRWFDSHLPVLTNKMELATQFLLTCA
jgi:hypothetical protein